MTTVTDDSYASDQTSNEQSDDLDTTPSEQDLVDVDELREKLAAAEQEAKVWKGRLQKTQKEEKKESKVSSTDLDKLEWKLENKSRINLVKDEYDKILADGYLGEKVSEKIALELAEKRLKSDDKSAQRNRQEDISIPSVTNRSGEILPASNQFDSQFDLSPEKKKKLLDKNPELASFIS